VVDRNERLEEVDDTEASLVDQKFGLVECQLADPLRKDRPGKLPYLASLPLGPGDYSARWVS
jgi:hypothetical protein